MLKLDEVVTTTLIIGFNVEIVEQKKLSFNVWDVKESGPLVTSLMATRRHDVAPINCLPRGLKREVTREARAKDNVVMAAGGILVARHNQT